MPTSWWPKIASPSSASNRSELGPTSLLPIRRTVPFVTGQSQLLGRQAKDRQSHFRHHPDAAVRHQKLSTGECHVIAAPNPADIAEMKKDPAIEMQNKEGLNLSFLAYNTQQKPFDDVRVRKALNMAVNKPAIIDAVYLGSAVVSVNPLPPSVWGYNKTVKDDAYDPEQARKLLAEAGVNDLNMKIWAMPVQRPYMPNARRAAELIQADFAKVGVTAEIVTYDWGEYLKRSLDKDRDGAVMLGWTGGIADPDNFLAALLSCRPSAAPIAPTGATRILKS